MAEEVEMCVEIASKIDNTWIEKADINLLCRACASETDENMIPIFEGTGLELDLQAKIDKHLPVKITKDDGLPNKMCVQCASTLVAWHDIYTGCTDAETKLKNLLNKSKDNAHTGQKVAGSSVESEDPVTEKPKSQQKVAGEMEVDDNDSDDIYEGDEDDDDYVQDDDGDIDEDGDEEQETEEVVIEKLDSKEKGKTVEITRHDIYTGCTDAETKLKNLLNKSKDNAHTGQKPYRHHYQKPYERGGHGRGLPLAPPFFEEPPPAPPTFLQMQLPPPSQQQQHQLQLGGSKGGGSQPNQNKAASNANAANESKLCVGGDPNKPANPDDPCTVTERFDQGGGGNQQNGQVARNWNREDAEKALAVELEYQKTQADKSLILRFPDPDLSRDIVLKYNVAIESVYFQSPSSPRFCFIQLKDDSNVDEVISELNKIKFGNGHVVAERKVIKNEEIVTPEAIDPYTLYVGNLPSTLTSKVFKDLFPNAHRIYIGYARKLKFTRYAYIKYTNVDLAIEAYKKALDMTITSRSIFPRFRRHKGTVGPPGEKPKVSTKTKEKAAAVKTEKKIKTEEEEEEGTEEPVIE